MMKIKPTPGAAHREQEGAVSTLKSLPNSNDSFTRHRAVVPQGLKYSASWLQLRPGLRRKRRAQSLGDLAADAPNERCGGPCRV
jgi:hypothetical protein